jgi:hypothetical protein
MEQRRKDADKPLDLELLRRFVVVVEKEFYSRYASVCLCSHPE